MTARVAGIYTSAVARAPMRSVAEVALEAGRGLLGDRYANGQGTFSKPGIVRPDAQITLIEQEEVTRFNEVHGLSIDPGDFRRNILTVGVRLNELAGRRFRVGDALLEGIKLCEPCAHLARLVSKHVLPGLVHRAGLRARILSGAIVRTGDAIVVEPGASDG